MELTEENVLKVLNELGGTPDEVAKSLLNEGCYGKPRGCNTCPISVYLDKKFSGYYTSVVGTYIRFFKWHKIGYYEVLLTVTTPVPVFMFIQEFDGYPSKHPELIA